MTPLRLAAGPSMGPGMGHAANVKRWQDGQMVLRWVAAGMGEARRQFRRVNGYLHLPTLRAALDQRMATDGTPTKEDAA